MVIGFGQFLVGLLVLITCWFTLGFVQLYFFAIFFRKKFKNFGRGFLKMVIGFGQFLVGLLVLLLCRFTMGFVQPCFFQFFSEKNLKNFGRGFLKMVIGLRASRKFIGSNSCRFTLCFVQVCFLQFFSEKNLKNFGRGVLKMVIGLRHFLVGLLVLIPSLVFYRFVSSNFLYQVNLTRNASKITTFSKGLCQNFLNFFLKKIGRSKAVRNPSKLNRASGNQ